MKTLKNLCILVVLTALSACSGSEKKQADTEENPRVLLSTNFGDIELLLYNETPLHSDNFLKLVQEGAYDSLLFHRVIEQFVIQAGDPTSKNASDSVVLGDGDVDYTIPAEIKPELFHKRGALGAARDGNPKRASSGNQFYIVQRGPQTDSNLIKAEQRINSYLDRHLLNQKEGVLELKEAIDRAVVVDDTLLEAQLQDSLDLMFAEVEGTSSYEIPEAHKAVYKKLGGTPHLDQSYTVFGEVTKGMDVVDAIAAVETNVKDRPVKSVRIFSARLVD